MFAVQYPKSKLGFSWQELGCLARSLGYEQDCLKTSLPDNIKTDPRRTGLTLKELDRMIGNKYYLVALDHTYNVHSDDWNIGVLRKAARMVCARFVSFPGLLDIRVAYQLYEDRDTKGMKTDPRTLSRCFKMCSRAIAPLKLQHRLKHMRETLEVKGRIQLAEFLDLVLWSDEQNPVKVQYAMTYSEKARELYKMADFKEIFEHHDLRLANSLNRVYLKEEWSFDVPVGGVRDRQRVKDGIMIHDKIRREQASANHVVADSLRPHVCETERQVQLSEGGHLLASRPQSAPELRRMMEVGSRVGSSMESRPGTAGATTVQVYMPELLRPWVEEEDRTFERTNFRPKSSVYSRCQTPAAVEEIEVEQTSAEIRELQFDTGVCIERHRYRANRDLEYLRPGILERLACRPKPAPPAPTPPQRTPRVARPSTGFLAYISSLPSRTPTPSHGKSCDARLRVDGVKGSRPTSSRA